MTRPGRRSRHTPLDVTGFVARGITVVALTVVLTTVDLATVDLATVDLATVVVVFLAAVLGTDLAVVVAALESGTEVTGRRLAKVLAGPFVFPPGPG